MSRHTTIRLPTGITIDIPKDSKYVTLSPWGFKIVTPQSNVFFDTYDLTKASNTSSTRASDRISCSSTSSLYKSYQRAVRSSSEPRSTLSLQTLKAMRKNIPLFNYTVGIISLARNTQHKGSCLKALATQRREIDPISFRDQKKKIKFKLTNQIQTRTPNHRAKKKKIEPNEEESFDSEISVSTPSISIEPDYMTQRDVSEVLADIVRNKIAEINNQITDINDRLNDHSILTKNVIKRVDKKSNLLDRLMTQFRSSHLNNKDQTTPFIKRIPDHTLNQTIKELEQVKVNLEDQDILTRRWTKKIISVIKEIVDGVNLSIKKTLDLIPADKKHVINIINQTNNLSDYLTDYFSDI